MKKGQISMEALMAMAIIILIYASIVGIAAGISSNAASTATERVKTLHCSKIASVMGYALSCGKGTTVELELENDYNIYPQRLVPQDDPSGICIIEGAKMANGSVDSGIHRLEVKDDSIAFH